MSRAVMAATSMAPPGPALNAPTARPSEPITAGLSTGPGPGPAPMPKAKTVADTLADMAGPSGDASLMEMAESARALGY